MNALANDQEGRIKWYLKQSGWEGAIRLAQYNRGTSSTQRAELRERPPHLLLTNYQMLEYLLVRPADRKELFKNHRMRFVVLDEVHTYGGTLGSHVALLLRRLQAHLAQTAPQRAKPIFVGASATIATGPEPDSDETLPSNEPVEALSEPDQAPREAAIQAFFGKLVGLEAKKIKVISEELETVTPPPMTLWKWPKTALFTHGRIFC